jgi:hypothetical protein
MFNTIMENKKLNEQLNKMKSLMTEQEVQEDMLDDIKDYLYGKVQGVSSKLGKAFDSLLDTGDSSEVSSSFTVPDEKPEDLSQEEKLKLFSTVKNDDDFYKAILFGIGAPTSKHNIDFLKLWRIAEMGTEGMNKKKVTATNNPFNKNRPWINFSLNLLCLAMACLLFLLLLSRTIIRIQIRRTPRPRPCPYLTGPPEKLIIIILIFIK